MKQFVPILISGLWLAAPIALAQHTVGDPTLVNLDTPTVLERGSLIARIELRPFGGDEDLLYTSLGLNLGLGGRMEGVLRGSFAPRRDFALPSSGAIRHGGNDVELALKMRLGESERCAGLIGVAFAGTPAQSEAFLTMGAMAAMEDDSATYYLNPRAVFIEGNTLVGIGLGARARLAPKVHLVVDFTPLVSGENTIDTTSGARSRRHIYGLAVRFTTGRTDDVTIDIGYTNGTGSTTGFGLTPGLGGSGAFTFALSVRR